MRSTDIDGEGNEADANRPASLSGSGRRLDAVIPFPSRRTKTAAGPAAGDDPSSSPAPFQSLGSVTQAVVLRLANDAVRLNVLAPDRSWEEEQSDPEP